MSRDTLRHDDHRTDDAPSAAPVIVLLHGAVQTRAIWSAQAAALAGGHRVVVPDLRGHGETPLGDRPLTIEGMAEDVLDLMTALGIGPAVVCGVSLGGMVALDMAARAPERVTALVLANTPRALTSLPWLRRGLAAIDPQRLLFPVFRLLGRRRTARVGLALAGRIVGPHWVGRTARRHFIDGFVSMSDEAIVATYGAIVDHHPVDPGLVRCPTLLVEGEDDAGSIRLQSEDLARRLRRVRRIVLRVGHVAPLDDPDAFNRTLLAFLAKLEADDRNTR